MERGGQSLIRLPNLIPFIGWQTKDIGQHLAHQLGALNLMFRAVGIQSAVLNLVSARVTADILFDPDCLNSLKS